MGSGPNWPYIVNYFEGFCKTYWWSTLLYVQNEVNVNEMVSENLICISKFPNIHFFLFVFFSVSDTLGI